MLSSLDRALPPIDVHAHLDPSVTNRQLQELGAALVFAVTRTLDDAQDASDRNDSQLLWGCGVHPNVSLALDEYDPERFRTMLTQFVLVGEVGLDHLAPAKLSGQVFGDIMDAVRDEPVLVTIHSAGRCGPVLDALDQRVRGAILHWFTGSTREIEKAGQLGAYFSVNAAMTDEQLNRIPPERALPETDFPFSRKAGSNRPGDIDTLEERLSKLWGRDRATLRQGWYRNLRRLCQQSRTLERLPEKLLIPMLSA